MSNQHIPNIGWAYFKGYYRDYQWENSRDTYQKDFFTTKNEAIYALALSDQPMALLRIDTTSALALQTTYPGLVTGTGLNHQTGALGESKLGFAFDPGSGLPYLPASSIKGALRGSFPQSVNIQKTRKLAQETKDQHRNLIKQLLAEVLGIEEDQLAERRNAYLKRLELPDAALAVVEPDFVDLLELELFEGVIPTGIVPPKAEEPTKLLLEPVSIYRRDIFHDAFPVETREPEDRFLGPDFITPHKHPRNRSLSDFTEPVPVLFLKILPEVMLHFQFDLKSGILSVEEKQALIEQLLLLQGVGAKTNVGYGNLIVPPKPKVYEKGETVSGEIKSIDGNDLTVYVEVTGKNYTVTVRESKLDFRNRDRYMEGKIYDFTVSSVDEKGNVKYIKG